MQARWLRLPRMYKACLAPQMCQPINRAEVVPTTSQASLLLSLIGDVEIRSSKV
jgi:hypothetical protein